MARVVKIDGSLGEGGGQVLRIALSLSAIFEIPIEIDNIRLGRQKPGLAAQHLKGVELAKEMCNARVIGANIGSTKIEFSPGKFQNHRSTFVADTGTAGCISLLAQVSLPCALLAPTSNKIHLIFKGGTNVPMGPHIEYLTEVFRPYLNRFGGDFDFDVIRRGYYPKGGGEFHLKVKPVQYLKSVEIMEPGEAEVITGWSYVAGVVNIKAAYGMKDDAQNTIIQALRNHDINVPPIDIMCYKETPDAAIGNSSGINLVCKTSTGCFFGGSGIGSKKDGNSPGIDAANDIIMPLLSKSCVDEHTQDQLVILMALAKGRSRIFLGSKALTSHTETAIKVAEIMLAERGLKFNLIKNNDSDTYILECNGCGFSNNFVK